eukprot:CAMPEP_0172318904 /NCGR_PEP_ID=MMETSP1058-20130122/36180_1 /TAXON_ID=83371 /ORGANISM="Detonula confervacea, Strain CCMP 353" /LENGTH=349 /DNA_ID=CAMNT_0013033827 /DNA_START=101 /DNA_END=1147 /DNA_ORIENTATION=+
MSLKHSVLQFKFEDFECFPSDCDYETSQEIADDQGNNWILSLYPGGANGSEDGNVSLYLNKKRGARGVSSRFSFIVRNASGDVYADIQFTPEVFEAVSFHGELNCIERAEIIDEGNNILVDGALLIDAHIMQLKPGTIHAPPSPLAKNMLQLLENEDNADVTFKVEGTSITAHRLILETNAPILAKFCGDDSKGGDVQINDTAPKIFRIILRYIYGGEVPDTKTILVANNGQTIIIAADRYSLVGLKLAVERALVESMVIHSGNFSDWLIFADAKNCPLLKEYAISYFVARSEDVLNSETSSKQLNESPKLLKELMKEISKISKNDTRYSNTERNMSVNELRTKLDEEG